jgi:hypothetical protein
VPSIRGQRVLTVAADGIAGFEFDTVEFGLLKGTVTRVANTYTLTAYKDNVLNNSTVIVNPSIQEIVDWFDAWFFAVTPGGKDFVAQNGLYIGIYPLTLSPEISLAIMTSYSPLPANWWQT